MATEQQEPGGAGLHVQAFRTVLPFQTRLWESLRLAGETEDRVCLDFGAPNAMMSYHLRQRGGEWYTAVPAGQDRAPFEALLGSDVAESDDCRLPYDNKQFDVVMILGGLEQIGRDLEFVTECHRILKPDGRLIVHVERLKTCPVVKPFQVMLGMSHDRRGMVRAGYTESELFNVLKNGFDVYNMRSYGKFFVTLTDTFVGSALRRSREEPGTKRERTRRIHAIAAPLYRVALQLDLLLFFTKGYHLIAQAKRRSWRSRNAPVLVDGRSISEAVLSRAPS